MCGRYTQTQSINQLVKRFQIEQLRFDDRDDMPLLLTVLHSYPDAEMAAHPVSTAINSPALDDSGCIASLEGDK
jgi:putative SOS response-associated peptidase YedK